jgi:hypothetical protein
VKICVIRGEKSFETKQAESLPNQFIRTESLVVYFLKYV